MNTRHIYYRRVGISLLIGLMFGVAITEFPIIFLSKTARAPKEITLVVPKGTAEQVARGEQPPSIPQNMFFVVGDTLVIANEDVVDHKLGLVWVPAMSSARIHLRQAEKFAFECSFQPDNYLGVDVREPLTLTTHILGALGTGVPLGGLIALYSLTFPVKKKENDSA